jgi:tetratricopeptide (TPR) repeat protein
MKLSVVRSPVLAPLALAGVASAILCASASADRLVTQDGRILSPKKARPEGAGYKLVFENGEIVLKDKSLVREVEVEGDMSDYVPANEDEKQKLAEGYVKYRARWMSAAAYQQELRKNFEDGKKRTEDIKAHSDWANAWTKTTKHFVFKTNTSPQLLDYYSELLEAYYDLQDQRIGIKPPVALARAKMAVNIYKSNEDFHKYGEVDNPAVLGYFTPNGKSLNFYHEYSEPAQTTWVALHECTHLLTYLVDPQYIPQIWVNEGVADYFGSSKVYTGKNGKLVIEPGQLQTDRILTVQQALKDEKDAGPATKDDKKKGFGGRPFTKLEDLFLLKHDEFDGFQYAHAWSFVYFLNTAQNGKYQKAFNRFFKGLYTTEKGIPVKAESYGKLVEPKDIRDYLLMRLAVKDVPALEAEWKAFVAAIPIDGVPARLKRGLGSVRRGEFESAIEDLDAAIAGGATDPRAWSARSKALMFQGKMEEALADARHAVEMDPLSPTYRYSLSMMMAGVMSTAGPREGGIVIRFGKEGEKIKNDEAKVQAGLAMELDPENERFREWFEGFE